MAIVLTIVLIAAPVGMQRYASYLEEQDWTVTATHLSTANQAARQYIKDDYDTQLPPCCWWPREGHSQRSG